MNIGENLIKARKAKGLSQEDVANELNVSRQSVSLWETDQTVPTIDNLVTLSKLYGVNVSILLGQEESNSLESNNTNNQNNDNSNYYVYKERDITFSNQKYLDEQKTLDLKKYKKLTIISTIFLIFAILNPDVLLLTMVLSGISLGCAVGAKNIKKNNFTLFLIVLSIFYLIVGILNIFIGAY